MSTLHRRSLPLEIEGFWWTPDAPDGARAGTVKFEPLVGLRLVLLGPDDARPPVGLPAEMRPRYPVMHGAGVGGEVVTLVDVVQVGYRGTLGGSFAQTAYFVDELLLGVHVPEPHEFRFKAARVYADGLVEWLTDGWHQRRHVRPGPLANTPGFTRVRVGDATVTFQMVSSGQTTRFRKTTETDAGVFIELPERLTVRQWQDRWVQPIEDLLVFATGARSEVDAFVGVVDTGQAEHVHPAIRRAASDRYWNERDVEIIRARGALPIGRPEGHGMLMPASVVPSRSFSRFVRGWFELRRRLGDAGSFFFDTLNADRVYLDNVLVNLLSFAEAYHRLFFDERPLSKSQHRRLREQMLATLTAEQREVYAPRLAYANEQTQRARVRYLVDRAVDVVDVLGPAADGLVAQLVDTRNWLMHRSTRSRNVVEGPGLVLATERLIVVLQTNVLLDLGLTRATALHGVGSAWALRPDVFGIR
jgi:hypothetical protein